MIAGAEANKMVGMPIGTKVHSNFSFWLVFQANHIGRIRKAYTPDRIKYQKGLHIKTAMITIKDLCRENKYLSPCDIIIFTHFK